MDMQVERHMEGNAAFQELVRTRGRLGWSLTAAILIIYYGFVGLVAFDPALMGMPIYGVITLGFPLGLGVIISAIALTGFYVLRANARFDALTRQIKESAP